MRIKITFAFLCIGLACFAQTNQDSKAGENKTKRISTVLSENITRKENYKSLSKEVNKVPQIDSIRINDKEIFDRVVERHKNLINGL